MDENFGEPGYIEFIGKKKDAFGTLGHKFRTPLSHPYNYDAFFNWRHEEKIKADGGVYTDRLLQWDFAKHDKLCQKHFGDRAQFWDKRDPKKIEAFLRDWTEDAALILVSVIQCCNQSSGYPLWYLGYKSGKKQEAECSTTN